MDDGVGPVAALDDKHYSMKAASRLTGLTPDTLRAWERRYQAVVPSRESKGRRLYSADDIERLTLLKRACDLGHPIRRVAVLDRTALEELVSASAEPAPAGNRGGSVVARLMATVEENDFEEFEQTLGWASASLSPRDLITHVVGPVLQEVGDGWHEGRISIAQEHAVSSIVRNLMGSIIRLYPKRTEGNGIVMSTLSGERHEFGILMMHMLASSEGYPSHYLGPDLPAEEIASAVGQTHSRLLALSAVNQVGDADLRMYRRLLTEVPPECQVLVGGASAGALASKLDDAAIRWVRSAEEFLRYLQILQP